MPISEQAVDVTFNAWWKEYGGTNEAISRALDRTRRQVGGAMPPGYSPPPYRQRAYKCERGNPMNSEFASSTLPTTAGRQNAIPIVMGEEEIRKFILDGRLEPMLGIFLPNAIDDETEKILRKALDSLKTHSALGQTKVLHDLKRNFTAMEQEWLDPRLLQQLAQQPCLIDSAKQTERDFAVFRKFYGDRPQADVNYELIEKLQNERVRKYLQDYDFIRKNPVAAGAYGLQRQLSDKGHAHAMKVAKAANLAFGLASKTASAKQWQGQESNSRLDLQAGGRKDLSMDFPNYSRRDSGVETGRQ